MAFAQSIVSYKDRGPYGDALFRGNTSGYLIKDLIETYQPSYVYDPMAGSGTTGDVCRHLEIPYLETDIREGYNVLNLTTRRIIEKKLVQPPDLIFWHPPYWNMVRYTDDPDDLAESATYMIFVNRCVDIMKWLGSLLPVGGHLALLLADLRLKSSPTTYFLTDDITESSRVMRARLEKEFRYIKIQHHTTSSGNVNYHDVQMVHEYLTIMRRR